MLRLYSRNRLFIGAIFMLFLSVNVYAAERRAEDFSLKNWDGRSITLQDLKGKVTLLTFSYSFCSVRCPIITGRLYGLDMTMNSPKDVLYVHISVDPDNDTPDRMKKYFSLYGIDASKDGRWVFLSGKKAELSKLWKSYGIKARKVRDKRLPEGYFMEYAQKVVVIDREGVIRYETGVDFSEDEVKTVIEKLNAKPSVKFAETRHDFGVVTEGDVVTHEFEFLNNGNAPLKIVDIVPA